MLVAVSPEDFLGDVSCLPEEGAMRGYVATLVNVEDEESLDGPGTSPRTSPLVACEQTVVFGKGNPINNDLLEAGAHYAATVYGYETLDLEPLEGDPETLVDSTGAVVSPNWTFTCGRMPYRGLEADEQVDWSETGAALAVEGTTRFVRGCQRDRAPNDADDG